MSKVFLNNITSFKNDSTAATTYNANNSSITTGFGNTLSLDGTQPNSMDAPLDMNSNQILNLPSPASLNSPIRVADLNAAKTGTSINVPIGGVKGQFLRKQSSTNLDTGWGTFPYVVVEDFGAVGNGVTDDSTAINNAIAAVAAVGGGRVLFGPKTYAQASTINVNSNNVQLIGFGGPQYNQGTLVGLPTKFLWTGGTNNFQLIVEYPNQTETADTLYGCVVEGIWFEGNNVAGAAGLLISGVSMSSFKRLVFTNHGNFSLGMNSTLHGPSTQHNYFDTIGISNSFTTGTGLLLDGQLNGNSSFNVFENFFFDYNNGDAIQLRACDSNTFTGFRMFIVPGGTGGTIVFTGTNASNNGLGFSAGTNWFFNIGGNQAKIIGRGTASGLLVPAIDNYVFWNDGNGTATYTADPDSLNTVTNISNQRASYWVTKGGTDQTGVVPGSLTVVTFPTINYNYAFPNVFDTGTNQATLPYGPCLLTATVSITGGITAGDVYDVRIYQNGTQIVGRNVVSVVGTNQTMIPVTAYLTPVAANGTTYDVRVLVTSSGGNKTISGDPASTNFRGTLLV